MNKKIAFFDAKPFDGGYLKNEVCYKCELKECLKNEKKRCF